MFGCIYGRDPNFQCVNFMYLLRPSPQLLIYFMCWRSASRTSVFVDLGTQPSVDEDFADVHQLVFEDDEENLQEEKEGDEEGDEDETKPEEELLKRTSEGAGDRVGKYSFAGVSSTDPPVNLLHLHVSSVPQL